MQRISIGLLVSPRHFGRLLGALCVAAVLVAVPTAARAQQSASAKIREHHTWALENYDLADYAAARDQLMAALKVAEEAKLSKEPIVVRTHLMLGAVYAFGLGDEASAIQHFKAALRAAPASKLEPPFDTEAAIAALAKADAELNPKVTCETLRGISHKPIAQAQAGVPLEISAMVEDILKPGTAQISYQLGGTIGGFVEIPMKRRGQCEFVGLIPAGAVRGEQLSYYITVKGKEGRVFAMRGNKRAPYIVQVQASARAAAEALNRRPDEVPNELSLSKPAQPRGGGCAGCSAGESAGSSAFAVMLAALVALRPRRRSRTWWLGSPNPGQSPRNSGAPTPADMVKLLKLHGLARALIWPQPCSYCVQTRCSGTPH